jgi:hypothetical protein
MKQRARKTQSRRRASAVLEACVGTAAGPGIRLLLPIFLGGRPDFPLVTIAAADFRVGMLDLEVLQALKDLRDW